MKILVLNSGSSSVKYKFLDLEGNSDKVLAEGGVEKIGLPGGFLKFKRADGSKDTIDLGLTDHQGAIKAILNVLTDPKEGCIKSSSMPSESAMGEVVSVISEVARTRNTRRRE